MKQVFTYRLLHAINITTRDAIITPMIDGTTYVTKRKIIQNLEESSSVTLHISSMANMFYRTIILLHIF